MKKMQQEVWADFLDLFFANLVPKFERVIAVLHECVIA